MICNISEEFTKELLDRFCETLNNLGAKEKLTILLNSRGGEYPFAQAMLELINSESYVNRITLVGFNVLASSAFELFFLAKCDRKLIDGTIGMYHQSTISVEIGENLQPVDNEDWVRTDYLQNFSRKQTDFVCHLLGFDKVIKDKIRDKNKKTDVWFTVKEMNDFLKKSNIYNKNNIKKK